MASAAGTWDEPIGSVLTPEKEAVATVSPIVLITGAARGLGRSLAQEFARRRSRLLLFDLPGTEWKNAVEELQQLGAPFVFHGEGDVTDPESLVQFTRACGGIDVLIANAGIGINTTVSPFVVEEFKRQIDVNLTGVANSIAAVLPGMIERRSGHIVAIASLAGYRGLPGLAGYSASKAGVIALMESMRVDLKQFGIRCTTVCPGWIDTGVLHNLSAAKPGVVPIEIAARKIAAGILRKRAFIAFPRWLRLLFALNRIQGAGASDWMLQFLWKRFGGSSDR